MLHERISLQVWSGLLDERLSVVVLRMLVTTTLCIFQLKISMKGCCATHKMPKANTNIKAILWLIGRRNEYIIGIGRNRMMASVAIEKLALAYQNLVILIQVPAIASFQAREIGVHWKIVEKVVATM